VTASKRIQRLEAIATELDDAIATVDGLYAERLRLWVRCRESGHTVSELAAASRLRPVTVRTLLDRQARADG
jgi:hypothetical protein